MGTTLHETAVRRYDPRGPLALAALLCFGPAAAQGSQWYVLCEQSTAEVVARDSAEGTGVTLLAGPLPGPRTAGVWIEENCSSRRCGDDGLCRESSAAEGSAQASGGWQAGELQTVTVGPAAVDVAPGVRTGPVGMVGPPGSDLSPLVDNATAAAGACNFPAALASAEHMTRFDPEHPWLVANHAKLRRLAERQRSAEQSVWQASSALESGKLKQARELAAAAADEAVSCQNEAVAQLLDGIEVALDQQRQLRAAQRSQAAAALLPGLMDLARIASGGQPQGTGSTAAVAAAAAAPALNPALADPCAFKYEYRNQWTFEPTCTCAGYVFDLPRHRCARAGG